LTLVDDRHLLDTNIVIALLNGDPDVVLHLGAASELFVPAVAL
jgi:predicted nucleic acid-binding protein